MNDESLPTLAPLDGMRVLDCSLLEPGATAMLLGELGAEVIKVEAPSEGDYIRRLAWPMVDGVSLLHWHVNRAKRSITIDLRSDEGVELFLKLVSNADVVVEGMRPGALARRGLTYERLCQANPSIVFCSVSGFGGSGPYRNLPSHGVAFDAWAGLAPPVEEDGHPTIPMHTSVGTKVAPVWAALGILAAVVRARSTGEGSQLDVAQSDVAAAVNWLQIEGWRAYERPESEVTGNPADDYERRPPGTAGLRSGVRYQYYATADGHILFMASEREFWRNFCVGVEREDLFDADPGAAYADHATGDVELRQELAAIFAKRKTQEWVEFGREVNTPICPVNEAGEIGTDPQFQARLPWLDTATHGAELLPSPLNFVGHRLPRPARAPTLGQDTDSVLRDVLGMDDDRIIALRSSGALGPDPSASS